MRKVEYLLSLVLALLVVSGMVAWAQASTLAGETALSCRPGKAASPVIFKGLSVYPRCPGAKSG